MSETRIPGQELQDEILKTVRKSQEALVDAIRTWAETVQSIAPKLPAVNMPLADIEPFVKSEIAKWADVIKRAGIQIE